MKELLTNSELPDEWSVLNEDDRSSTVAHFVGGYSKGEEGDVLIWKGTQGDNGNIHIDTNDDDYVEGKHEFVVEVMQEDTLVDTRFAEDIEEAYYEASKNLK